MCKSEVFNEVLAVVSSITGISSLDITSKGRSTEIVDARYILVYMLWRKGIYPPFIAMMMGYSRRGVEKMIAQFDCRRFMSGKMFEIYLEQIANQLRI